MQKYLQHDAIVGKSSKDSVLWALELKLVKHLYSFTSREKTLEVAEEVHIDEAFRKRYNHYISRIIVREPDWVVVRWNSCCLCRNMKWNRVCSEKAH